jgi:hypothetical protein
MMREKREREREESCHVITVRLFLASSSASSSSLWSPKTERKGIIEEGVVLPAAAEAGAQSRWMEGRKEGAAAAAHSKLRSISFFLYFFHHMISVISFVAKFSSFCEKYSEKRLLLHKFPFF